MKVLSEIQTYVFKIMQSHEPYGTTDKVFYFESKLINQSKETHVKKVN